MSMVVVAVVGAGVMGADIALDLSVHDYQVVVKDLNDEALQRADRKIRQSLKFMKMMKKGALPASMDDVLDRMRFVTDYGTYYPSAIEWSLVLTLNADGTFARTDTWEGVTEVETGDWSATEDELTLDPSDGASETHDYTLEGDVLGIVVEDFDPEQGDAVLIFSML